MEPALVQAHLALYSLAPVETFYARVCKLTKEAGAALHNIVLADLTQSAELMRISPKLQVRRVGALGVLQALRNYGVYFQHAGCSMGDAKVP